MTASETEALLNRLTFQSSDEFPTPPFGLMFFGGPGDDPEMFADFDLFYLESENRARDWDSGYFYGIGVSPDRQKVIFFAEYW